MTRQKKRDISIEGALFTGFIYNVPPTIENIKKFSSNKNLVIKAFLDFYITDKSNIDRDNFYEKYGNFLKDKDYNLVLPNKLWNDFKKHLYKEYFFQFLLENTHIVDNQCNKSLLNYSKLYYISFGKLNCPFSLLPEFFFHFENNDIHISYNMDCFDDRIHSIEPVKFKLFKNYKFNLEILKYLNNIINNNKDLLSYNFENQIRYKNSYLLMKMLDVYSANFIKENTNISKISPDFKVLQEKDNVLTEYMPIIKIDIPEYKFEYYFDLKKVCNHIEKKPYRGDKENKVIFDHYKVFLRDEMDYIFKYGLLKSTIEKDEINKSLETLCNIKMTNKRL